MLNIKMELHQMIDRIEDSKVLEAIHTLLFSQPVAFTTDGKPLNQNAYEAMIEEGEADIANAKTYSHEEVKSHFDKKINV